MTIEIHQPEIEALIEQHTSSGAFHDVEEVLLHALKSAPVLKASAEEASEGTGADPGAAMQATPYKVIDIGEEPTHKRSLEEVFAMVRGLADIIFSRNPSTGRPIDLT